MPKFNTKTYTESIEFIGKMATLPNANVDSEIAAIAFIYNQDLFKVGNDVMKFANKWHKLISKDNSIVQWPLPPSAGKGLRILADA